MVIMRKFVNKFFVVIFALFIVPRVLCASGNGEMAIVEGVTPISIAQLKEWKDEPNTYLLDANTPEVRNQYGYIPGAIAINVENWTKKLPADKNARLLFYCLNRLCFASSEAALIAINLGYKNTFVMLDGIEKWILDGNEVERIPGTDSSIVKKVLASDKLTDKDIKDYHDNIHSGLVLSKVPSCRDCHGESVKPGVTNAIDKKSMNSKRKVNENCASCHDKEAKTFYTSVHSQQVNPGSNVPKCTDCHSIHLSKKYFYQGRDIINIRKMADEKCGECHEKEQEKYHESFHGKAMLLNSPTQIPSVASCYDCHGTHNIHKVSDPRSTLSKENRVETCKECHPKSNENFANFIAHADHSNKDKNPQLYWTYIFMTGLLISVFSFFGIHTFLWCLRLIKTKLQNPQAWKEAKEKRHHNEVKIQRFTWLHKIQHFFLAASFLGLSFSGLPQKFYTSSWAQSMIDMMGGSIMATKIHHISAVIMFIVFFSHIAEILYRAYQNREGAMTDGKFDFMKFLRKLFGPDSLMPRWQDFIDIKDHFKWFIGIGQRPQFDRFTYWEKFDYLAVFWGMFIIGFSGLVLWFPTFFTVVFPGWFINLCTILHSDEALLATGFIFAIHFFNTHFRADRFPMDMVIFSGNLTEEEMKQERIHWYNRLKDSGKLEKLKVKDSFSKWEWFAKLIGFILVGIGLIFLALILIALLSHLL